MKQINSLNQKLQKLPFWEHLSHHEREYVQSNILSLSFLPGQQVLTANSQCLGVILVLSGVLRSYLLSPNGRELTLSRVRAGETYLLTASCVLDAISFDTHVEAETTCEVLLLPSTIYSHLVEENIRVECSSYKLLIEGYGDVVSSVERLVFLTLEQRLASFLLDESASTSSNTIQMTHEQLASSIGSARVAVSRTLKSMEKQQLVELLRGGIRILNKQALYAIIQ